MNEPEVENGFEDEDGCPDEALVKLDRETKKIEILDRIYFTYNSATIDPRSFVLLDDVAQLLATYETITLVEVAGHTDTRGKKSYNKRLSQRRVDSVVMYLIERGIASSRLSAVGYGEDEPKIVDARTEVEHAENRRVEFHILEQGDGVPKIRETDEAERFERD